MTGVWHQLASGQLTAATIVIWTCCGFVGATLGGALAGILLAGKDLGNELAGRWVRCSARPARCPACCSD